MSSTQQIHRDHPTKRIGEIDVCLPLRLAVETQLASDWQVLINHLQHVFVTNTGNDFRRGLGGMHICRMIQKNPAEKSLVGNRA